VDENNETTKRKLETAWITAGRELRIKVKAPFDFWSEARQHLCIAYLAEFGGPHGMVIDAVFPPAFVTNRALAHDAEMAGYFVSFINAHTYAAFDLRKFQEALMDWGYYGPPDSRPLWLTSPGGFASGSRSDSPNE
jgi:hypothetical protein